MKTPSLAPTWKYVTKTSADGIKEIEFSSWKFFYEFILEETLSYPAYVFRGQRDSSWLLESTLHRLLKKDGPSAMRGKAQQHLERFKFASRGRRGRNPASIKSDDEWWALGQHHDLATPLLDWSTSPFVALYFAFSKETASTSGKRAVYSMFADESINSPVVAYARESLGITIVRPLQDENARLVSQAGLFTKIPLGQSVESWVRKYYKKSKTRVLYKYTFPDSGRIECLQTLNRMNINHLSLFPDLLGASVHTNQCLAIKDY